MAPASPKYGVIETPKDGDMLYKEEQHDEPKKQSKLKELLFGVPGIILGAAIGILIGYLVQTSKPSKVVVSWIGVPGDLFIRAIKCCVTPLVFCSLVTGMADMISVGKAGSVGWKTFWLYMVTTALAASEGIVAVVIVRPFFSSNATPAPSKKAQFAMQCDEPGHFLSRVNETVACVFDAGFNASGVYSPSSTFVVTDVNGVFAKSDSEFTKLTLSESLQAQLQSMVPSNITQAFADASLLSIIMFAIPFGAAIALLPRDMALVAGFFREINVVFMTMIRWIITFTPFAIVSLLATSIAGQKDLGVLVSDVGVFVLADLVTLAFHVWVFYPVLMRIRRNRAG